MVPVLGAAKKDERVAFHYIYIESSRKSAISTIYLNVIMIFAIIKQRYSCQLKRKKILLKMNCCPGNKVWEATYMFFPREHSPPTPEAVRGLTQSQMWYRVGGEDVRKANHQPSGYRPACLTFRLLLSVSLHPFSSCLSASLVFCGTPFIFSSLHRREGALSNRAE